MKIELKDMIYKFIFKSLNRKLFFTNTIVTNRPPKNNVNGIEVVLFPENEKNKLLNIPDKRNKTKKSSTSIFLKKLTTYLV